MSSTFPPLRWDVFCRVIDNLGDVGVCWRLSRALAARGQQVRLWMDQTEALRWMAPGALEGHWPGITVLPWNDEGDGAPPYGQLPRSDVWIEAFGCEPPQSFIAQQRALWPADQAPVWINLEYLSAESYVERTHGLPSPLMSGAGRGWTRWFFYPGFTPSTGGLLREAGLLQRLDGFDAQAWRQTAAPAAAAGTTGRWFSLFCYEPPGLPWLLEQLHSAPDAVLCVTPGRAQAAVAQWLGSRPWPSAWPVRPWVDQPHFDEMLWACDFNVVRGEDSLVRALWAGQAFVWHIYPQHDGAHHAKLDAFLDWLDAPPDLCALHAFWNGSGGEPPPDLSAARLRDWAEVTRAARRRLLAQTDLTTQLLAFVAEKR